jgi:uncharacterized membrane protein
MIKRMRHDMRSSKSLRRFFFENILHHLNLLAPHEAKHQLGIAQSIVNEMHEELNGLAHVEISKLLAGIEMVVNFANELTSGSSDIERVKHRLMHHAGGRVWISFEILAASVISCQQVKDLQEMNPVLTSSDVNVLSACTVGILLRYVRYRQAVNCAEMCKGIANNIKSVLASLHASHDFAALSDVIRALQNKSAQLAESILAKRHYIDSDVSFDPRFLLFEFTSGFLLRQRQVELVNDFIKAQQEGKSSVHQMIMGEGKTQVITPLLLLMLANGSSLVIAVCPLQLLEQSRSQLRQRFSAVIHKRVLTFAFDRSTASAESVDSLRAILKKLEDARRSRSIVCSTSQAIKSIFLKRLEYLNQVRDMPRVCAVPLDCIPRQLRRAIQKKQTQYLAKLDMADELGRILALFSKENKGIALLDEVDLLLHPLHSELNFPVGQEEMLPLFSTAPYGQELRFQLPMFLLDAFGEFSSTSLETSQQQEALVILSDIKNAVDLGKSKDFLQSNPHLVLLDQQFYHQHLAHLISSWCCLWLSSCEDIKRDIISSNSTSWKNVTTAYLHSNSHEIDSIVSTIPQFSSRSLQLLNLCRDWVRVYLPHVLSKVHRVSFGLLLPADEERWVCEALNSTSGNLELAKRSVIISKSRRLLCVPFEGKDSPSRSAEFAHPDIAIGLTVHSYRLHGLRERDLRDLIQELKNNMMQVEVSLRHRPVFSQTPHTHFQEPGPMSLRRSRIMYDDWCSRSPNRGIGMLPLELLQSRSMSTSQLTQLLTLMAHVRPAVDFYLQHIVFPSVLKQRPHKLQANGVDLGGDMIFGQRFGFSGTPSDLLPPQLSPCHYEPGSEARIIRNLCSAECMFIPQELVLERNWNVHTLLQAIARGNYSALIDTGALVTGLSNEEVRFQG